jgi:hypothetical protein
MLHTLRFSLQNALYFIMLTFLLLLLFIFYLQDVLKFKYKASLPKMLNVVLCIHIYIRTYTKHINTYVYVYTYIHMFIYKTHKHMKTYFVYTRELVPTKPLLLAVFLVNSKAASPFFTYVTFRHQNVAVGFFFNTEACNV